MENCPCGTGFLFNDCCELLIRDVCYADTAEDLMRSRYTAFAKGEWGYLEKTRNPCEREEGINRNKSLQHKDILWTKLEILDVRKGGAFDEEGDVSFVAYYAENGEEKILRESSKFIKENGRWYYSERRSKVAPSTSVDSHPFVRYRSKVGRNSLCPCGSNKKFKKCCGK